MQLCATAERLLDIRSLWTTVTRTICDTHALCCSPSNTFQCRTLNRPGKGCSVTVQTCQHYGVTYCLGLRDRRWHKVCNPQVPAEGPIHWQQVPLLLSVVLFSGKVRGNYRRSSRKRQQWRLADEGPFRGGCRMYCTKRISPTSWRTL